MDNTIIIIPLTRNYAGGSLATNRFNHASQVLEERPESIILTQSIFNSEHTKEKFHNELLIHCSILELQELEKHLRMLII